MRADLPHTLYFNDKKKGKKGKRKNSLEDYKYNPNDPAIAKTREQIRKRRERMEREGKNVQYTMDEIFNMN